VIEQLRITAKTSAVNVPTMAVTPEPADITTIFTASARNRARGNPFPCAHLTLFVHDEFAGAPEERIAPALERSIRAMAGGMLLFLVLGYLYWTIYRRRRSRRTLCAKS
jgi:hypothetical protein